MERPNLSVVKDKMSILVTGGAGFIGSHVVDKLIEQGLPVVVIDDLSTGSIANLNPEAKFYQVDIGSPQIGVILEKEKPELVFHLAAQISVKESFKDPCFDATVNILGSLNLFEHCRKHKVKKIIFASTAAVYGDVSKLPIGEDNPGNPLSPYGISKYTVERYLKTYQKEFDLDFTILRFANVYGPRQNPGGEAGVVSVFINEFLNGRVPVIFGNGKQTRDLIYVEDVAEAGLFAISKGSSEIINISTGQEVEINKLFHILADIFLKKVLPVYGTKREGDIQRSSLANDLSHEILGWYPKTELHRGLNKTVEYFIKRNG